MVRHWARVHGFGGGVSSTETETYALKESYGSHAVLLRWLAQRPAAKVLDAGCFDGRFADMARRQGHQVTGLDRQKYDGVAQRVDSFIEADLNEPLPAFLHGQYDVVVAGDVLEHVVEPHALLSELARALKPGGEILVSVPNFGHWYPRGRTALGKFDYDQRGPLDRGHVRFFTRDSIEALIGSCGLVITEHATVGTPFDTIVDGLVAVARAPGDGRRPRRPRGDPRLAPALRVPVPVPPGSDVIPAPGTDRNKLVGTTAGLLVGGLAFFLTLFDYTFSLTRTALASGFFSGFYDLQGRRLLDGHLDVPDGSLGIEGFVRGGRTFMYFPPWPAILRLPVLMTTHEYDVRLSLLSMALAWIVFAVMVVKLVWLLVPVLSGAEEVSRTTARRWSRCSSRSRRAAPSSPSTRRQPWVYHEAYMWAVAAVFGGIYWLARLLARPTPERRLVAVRVQPDQRRHPGDRGLVAVPGRDRGRSLHALPARQVGPPGPVVAGAARRRRSRC